MPDQAQLSVVGRAEPRPPHTCQDFSKPIHRSFQAQAPGALPGLHSHLPAFLWALSSHLSHLTPSLSPAQFFLPFGGTCMCGLCLYCSVVSYLMPFGLLLSKSPQKKKKKFQLWHCANESDQYPSVSMRTQVRSLALLSGLEI